MVEPSSASINIATAEALKLEGNELYRAGSYKEAIAKYSKIFLYVNGLISAKDSLAMYSKDHISSDEVNAVNELKHSAYANMAGAYLSLKQYHKVIEKSRLALEIKDNPKVLYRRALAYISCGDIDNAQIDLDKANSLLPNDPGIIEAYKRLGKKREEVLTKEKQVYKGFFNRLNSE